MPDDRRCPVLQGTLRRDRDPDAPTSIPWSLAEKAYEVYSSKYGTSQSLERLAERGGFGLGELDEFVPGWREAPGVVR